MEALFARLPLLKKLYELRVCFTNIFDTAPTAQRASKLLIGLEIDAHDAGLDLGDFFTTYFNHEEGILNYFEHHQTSAAVEGINNKARVVIKRAYGLKSAESLWKRLVLDLNRADALLQLTIDRVRELVVGIKTAFGWGCT